MPRGQGICVHPVQCHVKGDTGGAYERSETGVVHYNTQLFISSGREIRYDVGASEGAQVDIDLVRHTACFRAAEGRHQDLDNEGKFNLIGG